MAVDDAQAEALAAKAEHVAALARATDVQTLYTNATAAQRTAQHKQDQLYAQLVPTFLALHEQAASSQQLLGSLEQFLSTFQADLSALSTHISALQTTSQQIDTRLDATRDVEVELASFLADIALSPRIVDLFLESEPEARPELWLKAVVQLEKVLDATTVAEPAELAQSQAVKQVQAVAQACRHLVTAKLRPFLTAPHAAIKASVTTNIQVLQTSVLLRHHRPLYGFLARQAPRVAIDVQRSYVAAARLYYETAFRRYTRSLGIARKRWTEPSTLTPITDARVAATPAPPAQQSDAEAMSAQYADPWLFHPHRLQYSKLDGPPTVLGYMADDAQYKACPENLFRSASLVMLDNVCSEYTFLVRFFDGLEAHQAPDAKPAPQGSTDTDSAVDDQPAPEPEASVVQLTRTEQARLQPRRGAVDLIFKQIFEPAILSWTAFANSLLPASSASTASSAAMPSFLSLLSMVRLNDSLLQLLESRGCTTPMVESALMGFKIHAYPLLKRQLDDQIAALVAQRGGTAAPAGASGMWGLLGGATAATKADATSDALAAAIGTRYASLFTKTVAVLDDTLDDGLFANLLRMRQEVEKLIVTSPALRSHKARLLQTILHTIENGASSLTHPKIQNEASYWNEALRAASTS